MGSRKIIHIDHVGRTITLFTIYALLLLIRRIDFSNFADKLRMRLTLTVETQLLSNEKFGNRSSENVALNLNLLISIFLSLLVSFSFSTLCLDFIFIHSRQPLKEIQFATYTSTFLSLTVYYISLFLLLPLFINFLPI